MKDIHPHAGEILDVLGELATSGMPYIDYVKKHGAQMKDLKQMAVEAGMAFNQSLDEFSTPLCDGVHVEQLSRFAALVAEDCAKVADETIEHGALDEYGETYAYAAAAAIRARWGVKEG